MRTRDGKTVVYIDGKLYAISLPTGGTSLDARHSDWDKDNDWDNALKAGCKLNWKGAYSWCVEHRGASYRAVRGCLSEDYRYFGDAAHRNPYGFRPVLTPLYAGPLTPDNDTYAGRDGQVVELGSIRVTEEPPRIMFGDTCSGTPIKWAVFNGKLIAVDNLVAGIDWNSLNNMGFVPVKESIQALVRILGAAACYFDYETVAETDHTLVIGMEDGQTYTITIQEGNPSGLDSPEYPYEGETD